MANKTGLHRFRKMSMYASADMLGGGVFQIIATYFLAYLTFVEEINPALAGIAIMIGKIWDGISDPLMGIIVEKTRTRFGSIRPYLLIGTLPVFLSYFMLWYSFGLQNEIAKTVYYTFSYVLFSTAYTVVIIPYEALLPKMVDSYNERTNYITMRMIFSGIACVVSTYLYEFIINRGSSGLSPELEGRFALMGIVLGLFFSLPVLVTFIGTREKAPISDRKPATFGQILFQYYDILRSGSYRKFFFMGIFSAFMSGMLLTGMSFFSLIILSQDKILGLSVITIIITIKGFTEIAFFPVNVFLMKKFSKQMPYITDIPLIILACIIGLFIPLRSCALPFIISISLLGMGMSCLGFVPMALLPDLSDIDELIFGTRREGLCAGLATLIRKISGGISIFVTGLILSAHGLKADRPDSVTQTAREMWGVKIIYAIIPIICCIIILIIVRSYRLNQNNHSMIKEIIAEKRLKGKVSLSEEQIKECEMVSGLPYEKLWISKS